MHRLQKQDSCVLGFVKNYITLQETAAEQRFLWVCPFMISSSFPVRLGRRHHPPANPCLAREISLPKSQKSKRKQQLSPKECLKGLNSRAFIITQEFMV